MVLIKKQTYAKLFVNVQYDHLGLLWYSSKYPAQLLKRYCENLIHLTWSFYENMTNLDSYY
jgi:hypothetical protein